GVVVKCRGWGLKRRTAGKVEFMAIEAYQLKLQSWQASTAHKWRPAMPGGTPRALLQQPVAMYTHR
ncbi:MAG: hypothetical protein ACYSWU_21100, partial [Planctomycetota bacterium]